MNLAPQPLEVADFSGGISDNILQGDPRRSAVLDNLYITADKKLEERFGMIALADEAYRISGSSNRIANLFSTQNETYLFNQVNDRLHVLSKNFPENTLYWQEVFGVADNIGNVALPNMPSVTQLTVGEYLGQNYATGDGTGAVGTQPMKFYRNDQGSWVAKTGGLPRSYVSPTFSESTLLQKCILLANDLRSSMIAHMKDAQFTANYQFVFPMLTNSYLHMNIDKYSLSYLEAVSFNPGFDPEIPDPVPTPAPAATNEASLFALVTALNLAYQHHMTDSMKAAYGTSTLSSPLYHMNMVADRLAITASDMGMPRGPGASVNNNSTPEDLETAAAMLDDLHQKWNWHRQAVNTHSQNNQLGYLNKYPLTQPKIGDFYLEDALPTVTPDMSDVINFANNLKSLYNKHITSDDILYASHKQGNNANWSYSLTVTLPDATTLDEAFLLIYWIRAQYTLHTRDASFPTEFIQISCNAVANSPNLTGVTRTDTGAAYDVGINRWVEFSNNTVQPRLNARNPFGSYTVARVISSGSGTMTLDRPMVSTLNGTLGQSTFSQYHKSTNNTNLGTLTQSLTSPELSGSTLGNPYYSIGASTSGWITLGEELFNSLSTHATNLKTHAAPSGAVNVYNSLMYNVPYPELQIPSVALYSYAFFFSDRYTVGINGTERLTLGNPVFTLPIECAVSYPIDYVKPNQSAFFPAPFAVLNTRANVLTNLPVLQNTGLTNYDVNNVKLNIYRTTDGGATYYEVAELDNGTTTYTDTINDSITTPGQEPLEDRQPIYTSGGVVGYDQPPLAKFFHIFDGIGYYGAVVDGEQYFPNRILQSVDGIPDAVPGSFSLDLDDNLTGISSTKANLVALCETSLFRISNRFNSLGQGSLEFERISDVVGSLNAKGVVQTEIGLFFAGTDGFYYTDAFQVIKVSLEIDDSYKLLTESAAQRRSIYGTYDRLNRRVHWSMRSHATSPENDVMYVLHLNMGVKPSAAFTRLNNYPILRPTCITYFQGELYTGLPTGHFMKFASHSKYDSVPHAWLPPAYWERVHIPYDYTSTSIDMGSTFNRKYLTKMHAVGQNRGNMSFTPYALKDLNQTQKGPQALAPVNYVNNWRWGAPSCVWGSSEAPKWEYDGKMDLWRRFPRNTLRSDFMQVSFKPHYGVVYASTDSEWPEFAYVTIDPVAKTAVLQSPSGYTNLVWPLDIIGMDLALPLDEYQAKFPIVNFGGQQTIMFETKPNAGNFRVNYNGNSTPDLPYTSTAATVQTQLRLLPGLSGVFVSGDFNLGFTVQFGDEYPAFALSVTNNTLTREGVAIATEVVAEPTEGSNFFVFEDPDNALAGLTDPFTVEWQIMGYKKEQRFSLSSYTLHFAYLGTENQAYPGPYTNSGPGNAGGNPP